MRKMMIGREILASHYRQLNEAQRQPTTAEMKILTTYVDLAFTKRNIKFTNYKITGELTNGMTTSASVIKPATLTLTHVSKYFVFDVTATATPKTKPGVLSELIWQQYEKHFEEQPTVNERRTPRAPRGSQPKQEEARYTKGELVAHGSTSDENARKIYGKEKKEVLSDWAAWVVAVNARLITQIQTADANYEEAHPKQEEPIAPAAPEGDQPAAAPTAQLSERRRRIRAMMR